MSDLTQRPPRPTASEHVPQGRAPRRRPLFAAAALVVLVAVLVPWLAVRGSGGAAALPAGQLRVAGLAMSAVVSPLAVRTLPPLPRPTSTRPLKIYFGGDSMAGYPIVELNKLAAATHVMRVKADSVTSSRLCYNVPVNWPAHLTAQLRLYHPAAAVFMIGANDGGASITVNGRVYGFWTTTWFTAFRKKVGIMMDIMLRNGVKRIYWIGMPIMKPGHYPSSAQMRRLNTAFMLEAKLRPAVRSIDIWRLLATSTGAYDPQWRATWDPTHLNPAGARRIALKVMAAIKSDWLPPL
jgi:hypothetical protein